MPKILKTFLVSFLVVALFAVVFVLVLLRYPTDQPEVNSQFAPRAQLEGNLPEIHLSFFDTGHSMGPEIFLVEGGRLTQTRKMIYSAILVEHPEGNLLIDAGLGRDFSKELEQAPWLVKNFFGIKPGKPLIENPEFQKKIDKLQGILISHGHWDHLSGAKDFPELPIYLLPEEIQFLTNTDPPSDHIWPHQVDPLKSRFKAIELKDTPYENFPKSFDWFGDGSVVLVSLAGHTPGSLGIFVNKDTDKRLFMVGDALWTVDINGGPEKRSFLAELLTDTDRMKARIAREKLRELINHSNEVTLVPAHDPKALEKLN